MLKLSTMADQYNGTDRVETEQYDVNGTLEAVHYIHTSCVQGQRTDATERSGEHHMSRQEAEQDVLSQEAERTGGSTQGFMQGDIMRDELQNEGTVLVEPGIEVQRDTNEEAVLTRLVSTPIELAQDVLREEVPDLCK